MKPYLASLINAFVLVLLGLWGYFGSDSPSVTALIPVVIGLLLLLMNRGLRKQNRVVAHLVAVLTLLTLSTLVKPLTGAIGREDATAILRVSLMIATTLFAFITFVKSFLDARAAPKNQDTNK